MWQVWDMARNTMVAEGSFENMLLVWHTIVSDGQWYFALGKITAEGQFRVIYARPKHALWQHHRI